MNKFNLENKVGNKLPRKRKKLFKKVHVRGGYFMAQTLNELLFEEKGKPCIFPKVWRNPLDKHDYKIIGRW